MRVVRRIGLALATCALAIGMWDVASAQAESVPPTQPPAPVATPAVAPASYDAITDPRAMPTVVEHPDLRALWPTGMTLQYHETEAGDKAGTLSHFTLEEFIKDDCPRAPCSKWHGYFPDDHGKKIEDLEYYDGDGNLFKLTLPDGRAVFNCYPHLLRFPLKVPGDQQDGCSGIAVTGLVHSTFQMHYEWERVGSTSTHGRPVWAIHVTIRETCTNCQIPTIAHRYYDPQKAVWLLRVTAGKLDDLVSITPGK